MKLVQTAVLLVFVVATVKAATECYTCNSIQDTQNCTEVNKGTTKGSCNNKKCYKAVGTFNGQAAVSRGCGNPFDANGDCLAGPVNRDGASGNMVCCDGNNCNTADTVMVPSIILSCVLLAQLILF